MDIVRVKEIINNHEGFKTSEDIFIKENIIGKIERYSHQHIELLKVFYDLSADAIATARETNVSQFQMLTYYDIEKEVEIKEPILGICWIDLENDGFIIEVKSYKYAIKPLGILFIEKLVN